jgi:hypothetical protein
MKVTRAPNVSDCLVGFNLRIESGRMRNTIRVGGALLCAKKLLVNRELAEIMAVLLEEIVNVSARVTFDEVLQDRQLCGHCHAKG